MWHDSTWLGQKRVTRRMRPVAALGLLLAWLAFAWLPASASATTPEMRGEWELVVKTTGAVSMGKTVITTEANAKGEFTSPPIHFNNGTTGTLSGTLEGSTASVKIITEPFGPYPSSEFSSTTMKVETGAGSLALSGEGTFTLGSIKQPATLVVTRIRTYKQIEEQEAREKQEREEAEARANVRGEWALTLTVGPQTSHATALILQQANQKNEFASRSALFEGVDPGTFSGTLKLTEASVTVTAEAYGPVPASTFTSSTMKVESSGGSMSISGSGSIEAGGQTLPATLAATRTKTYQQVVEREEAELKAKERQEKEAIEKLVREHAEKVAREAQEQEQQAKALKEREAREAAEKLAAAKIAQGTTVLVSALLAAKGLTTSSGGTVSLGLTNPNGTTVQGLAKLTLAKAGSPGAKHTSKSSTLGEATFSIAPNGSGVVKVKLSRSGRSMLARLKALHVILTLTTQASGEPSVVKTYSLTLHAGKARSKR